MNNPCITMTGGEARNTPALPGRSLPAVPLDLSAGDGVSEARGEDGVYDIIPGD